MDKVENIIKSFEVTTGGLALLGDFIDEIIERNKVLEKQTQTLSADYLKYRKAFDSIDKCVNNKGALKKITKIINQFKIDNKNG